MEPIIDTSRSWTTRYTTYDEIKRDHVQKTVTIDGVKGSRIQIDNISLMLGNEFSGNTASCLVTMETAGLDYQICEFTQDAITYTKMEATPGFIAVDGDPVTLRFHLKTSKKESKAMMKEISYTYSLIDVPIEPPVEVPCLIVIECESESVANGLIEGLKVSGYLEGESVKVYKRE